MKGLVARLRDGQRIHQGFTLAMPTSENSVRIATRQTLCQTRMDDTEAATRQTRLTTSTDRSDVTQRNQFTFIHVGSEWLIRANSIAVNAPSLLAERRLVVYE